MCRKQRRFSQPIQPVVIERCDLIGLLNKDIQASTSEKEAFLLVGEIAKLAQANISGDDSNGDGVVGNSSAVRVRRLLQLRKELEAMIARERPPYVTVDQWYLFNLVKLPNGEVGVRLQVRPRRQHRGIQVAAWVSAWQSQCVSGTARDRVIQSGGPPPRRMFMRTQ